MKLVIVACLFVVALGVGIGSTSSAFSDTTANGPSSFQAADSFCTSPGTQTLGAAADNSVWERNPSTTYGALDRIGTMAANNNGRSRVLIRFALPAIPAGCTVTDAKLRLYGIVTHSATLEVHRAAAAWTEATTWNTRPGFTGTPVTTTGKLGWVEWGVLDHVNVLLAGPNDGFLIRDANETRAGDETEEFRSRENAAPEKPQLVLTLA